MLRIVFPKLPASSLWTKMFACLAVHGMRGIRLQHQIPKAYNMCHSFFFSVGCIQCNRNHDHTFIIKRWLFIFLIMWRFFHIFVGLISAVSATPIIPQISDCDPPSFEIKATRLKKKFFDFFKVFYSIELYERHETVCNRGFCIVFIYLNIDSGIYYPFMFCERV